MDLSFLARDIAETVQEALNRVLDSHEEALECLREELAKQQTRNGELHAQLANLRKARGHDNRRDREGK